MSDDLDERSTQQKLGEMRARIYELSLIANAIESHLDAMLAEAAKMKAEK
jgi:hypothetical protein